MSDIRTDQRYGGRRVSDHHCDFVVKWLISPEIYRFIAILLGRLSMSVDDAIEAYISIFDGISSYKGSTTNRGPFLREKLRELVKKYSGNADTLMLGDVRNGSCRRYVRLPRFDIRSNLIIASLL